MPELTSYKDYKWVEKLVLKKLNNFSKHKLVLNPDKYGIDILVTLNKKIVGGIECEWKGINGWSEDFFPFKTVHFLMRKRHFKNMDLKSVHILIQKFTRTTKKKELGE